MALHKRTDFAKLCGVERNYISTYIKRGKIILSGDYIDDSIPENFDFYRKQTGKDLVDYSEKSRKIELTIAPPVIKPAAAPNIEPPKRSSGLYALDAELKRAELAKKAVDTRIALLKEEKMMGAAIPTEMVKMIFVQHSKNITSSFHAGADNLLMEISKTKRLTRNELAEFRGKLIKIINAAVEKSIEESKRGISDIVQEYSLKKEVGERE